MGVVFGDEETSMVLGARPRREVNASDKDGNWSRKGHRKM